MVDKILLAPFSEKQIFAMGDHGFHRDAPHLSLCEPPGSYRHPVGAQLQECVKVFCGRHILPWALSRSYGGGLKRSRLRTLYWRLTLGYFPTDTLPPPKPPTRCGQTVLEPVSMEENVAILEGWLPHVCASRQHYKELQQRVLAPPSAGDDGEDATHNNPLQHGNVEWNEYFQRVDWSKVVEKDLARLDLADTLDPFFAIPRIQV